MLDPDFFLCELLTVPPDVALRAVAEISGCEACSWDAQLAFRDLVRDDAREGMYEFILASPVRCPLCHGPVTEKTLIGAGGPEVGVFS